ncbi:glutaredoxin family protein [Nocardia puris]|uniref:glutaredoxin family protein n=1 Tax=Nocardia puris TaxID=208602 RepID=UPI00189466C4|nr:glutaredoxin family protein [Nocardia puris]MBF6213726.1 glutaredoxin family protein [Nocardia puris]
MPEITVYGRPGCGQCLATTQHLTRRGVPHAYVDVSADPAGVEVVTSLGYQALPVVVAGDVHWSGYRHTRLQRLAEIHATCPDLAVLEPAAIDYLAGDPDA